MATKPTPGASDGTYGTELNAFLDVSLDVNGKIATEALQTDSTAPSADAAVANKKYVDDQVATKEDVLVTQSTASIFGARTTDDTIAGALVKAETYRAQCDGILVLIVTSANTGFVVDSDSGSTPSVKVMQILIGSNANTCSVPILKDDYLRIDQTDGSTAPNAIAWYPIGTGGLVKQ